MTDTIMSQVFEQVKKAVEAANSARPLPYFDYMPTTGCEPSHRDAPVASHRHSKGAPHVEKTTPDDFGIETPQCLENGHTTTKCQELGKALHELADKGQIDCLLKRGPCFLRKEHEPTRPELRWEAQLRGAQQVLMAEQGSRVTVPTMVFEGGRPILYLQHSDPLVVEMKVAITIVWRILINTGSLVDIVTWDCLKKLTYQGREIVPLVHPILGFGGQEVNPTGVIRLLLCFGEKTMARNLEVDFLVVNVPSAYNVILGRPTLHKYDVDDGSVGMLQGDQQTARECYLASIRSLVEKTTKRGPVGPPPSDKKPQTTPPPPAETLVAPAELEWLRLEAVDGIKEILLDEERLERTVLLVERWRPLLNTPWSNSCRSTETFSPSAPRNAQN
ncbi:hypothetical protein Cgig2_006391 [Carnegiea gigantea]|uniref:Uncharacterized protein n=1 Tax=Carnegiea gigantea TaxID=171969 RepID=A0A9Q1K605_9CARY|nr:hypothetical protein Cgig2_006391 [Carnegiea gigantea]